MNALGPLERNIEGEPEYKKIPPDGIREFRNLSQSDEIVLPERQENRRCTDTAFLIILVIFVLTMTGFTIGIAVRCMKRPRIVSDDYHHDHDRDRPRRPGDEFTYRKKRQLFRDRDDTHRHDESDDKDKDRLKYVPINVKNWCLTIIFMPVIAFVMCLLIFIGLRICTKGFFWFLTVLELLAILGAIILCCVLYAAADDVYLKMQYMIYAIANGIFLILICVLIFCLRKRIKLIIAVYEEALRAIFKVPALLLTPLLSILAFLVVLSPMIYLPILFGNHKPDALDGVYFGFMLFKFYWLAPFVQGSQCILIAGCVATYYFARNKSNLGSPYCTSLCTYIRFHLGTVAAGSFIIAVISMMKRFAEWAMDSGAGSRNLCLVCLGCCCMCILQCMKEIAEYMTRKAYIMTAVHGQPLCASGKRAMRLLWSNLLDTIAVDNIGTLALGGAALLIIVGATGVGIAVVKDKLSFTNVTYDGIINGFVPLLIGLYEVLLIVIYYLAVLGIAIETIFLCFCDDKLINDGSRNRPYFMSQNLYKIVQSAFDEKYQ